MSAPSRTKSARSNESTLLRAAGDVTYSRLAVAVNHDASYISRFFADQQKVHLSEVLTMFEVAGLALVRESSDTVTLDRRELDALVLLARKGLESAYRVGQMIDEVAE